MITPLTAEQVREFLRGLRRYRDHAIVYQMLLGGLRTREVLPKIPTYLPRPFPVEADHELQRQFRQADTLYGQALFLMRRSGVRIGELVRLEPRCLDEDLHGHVFLKVPLGKLDNERLVPLDDETTKLAERLQTECPAGASFLLEPHLARSTIIDHLRATLKDAADGLDIPGPVVSHRLRHSYATELLNAGMSIIAVMKLLGHRSLRMTMRYAAITQETVVKEFYAATAKTAARYELPAPSSDLDEPDLDRALLDVIYALRSRAGDAPPPAAATRAASSPVYTSSATTSPTSSPSLQSPEAPPRPEKKAG